MKKEGLSDEPALQAWVTSRVSAMLAERGKITIGWDEVLDGAETCGLSPSFIVQSWRGAEGGEKGARMKHQVIMSPQHDGCYFDHKNFDSPLEPGRLGVNTVKAAYTCALVPRDVPSDMASYVIGGECTLWTEAVTSAKFAEYMMFPRLCAFSEALWDEDDKKDFARFSRAAEVQKRRLAAIDILCYQGVLE
jgi:hexosaminidase